MEILLAGTVLAVVAVSLYGAYSAGFAQIRLTQESLRADQILVEKLETLRVYNWADVAGGIFFPTNFTAPFSSTSRTNLYAGSLVIATVPITESYSNNLRRVTAMVAWQSGGLVHIRSMSTLFAQNGIYGYPP